MDIELTLVSRKGLGSRTPEAVNEIFRPPSGVRCLVDP
jgi:hypothetical protein